MASRATGILKNFDDAMPSSLVQKFGSPAAAAWAGAFLLIGTFALINYGVGQLLSAMMHPGTEEVAMEPASVVVDLPPPAARVGAPAAAPSVAQPSWRRSSQWGTHHYRHGWNNRRWHDTAVEPAAGTLGQMLNPHLAASHASVAPLVHIEGLPKHIIDTPAAAKQANPPPTPAATAPKPIPAAATTKP